MPIRIRLRLLAALMLPFTTVAAAQSVLIAPADSKVSIRKIADEQRAMEELEFLRKMNGVTVPESLRVKASPQVASPAANPVTDKQPVLDAPKSSSDEPAIKPNTVMSVYGPSDNLQADITAPAGGMASVRKGDVWFGTPVLEVRRDGVLFAKPSRTSAVTFVTVGAQLKK